MVEERSRGCVEKPRSTATQVEVSVVFCGASGHLSFVLNRQLADTLPAVAAVSMSSGHVYTRNELSHMKRSDIQKLCKVRIVSPMR